jgi:hypothetical protein
MDMSVQIPGPAILLSGKMPGGWVGCKAGLVTLEYRRNILPLPEIEPWFLILAACDVVTVLTESSRQEGVSHT